MTGDIDNRMQYLPIVRLSRDNMPQSLDIRMQMADLLKHDRSRKKSVLGSSSWVTHMIYIRYKLNDCFSHREREFFAPF